MALHMSSTRGDWVCPDGKWFRNKILAGAIVADFKGIACILY